MAVYGMVINEYSLVWLACLGIGVIKIVVLFAFSSITDPVKATAIERAPLLSSSAVASHAPLPPSHPPGAWVGAVTLNQPEKYFPRTLTTQSHVHFTITLVASIMFVMNVSVGFYMATFQPILVNVFNYDQAQLSEVAMVYCALALIPPLIVSIIAKKYSSRSIALAGLVFKLLGMVVYSAPPGNLYQLCVGYVMVLKGALFFFTSMIALMSQVLNRRMTPIRVGIVTAVFAIGQCFHLSSSIRLLPCVLIHPCILACVLIHPCILACVLIRPHASLCPHPRLLPCILVHPRILACVLIQPHRACCMVPLQLSLCSFMLSSVDICCPMLFVTLSPSLTHS
jgi:hypothetical protein